MQHAIQQITTIPTTTETTTIKAILPSYDRLPPEPERRDDENEEEDDLELVLLPPPLTLSSRGKLGSVREG